MNLKQIVPTALLLLQTSLVLATGSEVNKDLAKKIENDYTKAVNLQRKEGKIQEAKKILEKYDKMEGVPVKLRRKVLHYKTWLYCALKEYDKSHTEFMRLLEIDVPKGVKCELDVPYGPDPRQKLDIYLPKGASSPTPILVLIHGGGWLHGEQRSNPMKHRDDVAKILANGGAVASITYRLTKDHKLPAPLMDAARAIQFLRYNAKKYNLDKKRFVASGHSAGGCSTLWLATHDDLADPKAKDPILRESSRLSGAIGNGAQTTLDPVELKKGDIIGALKHSMFSTGLKTSNKKLLAGPDAETQKLIDYCSPVKHLDANDPPIVLNYTGPISKTNDQIHHPKLGLIFKKKADKVGAKCSIHIRKEKDYPTAESDYILKMMGLK